MPYLFLRRFSLRLFLAAFVTLVALTRTSAQTAASGVIEGRVFNAATGASLRNARVIVEETRAETITDDFGGYRLTGLNAGPVRVSVSYVGFDRQTATVSVVAGAAVQRDFELKAGGGTAGEGETIVLQTFNVVADREMSVQAVALNERRNAASIKNVVSFDEYGDIGDENVGEFMRFLPGVAVNDSGLTASSITLRGFPSNNTGMQMDGVEIASRNNSRSQSILDVSTANISRVEVTKVPTPDMPASGLGGSINVISKSGFDSKKPVFAYQLYMMGFSTPPLTLKGGPKGPVSELSPAFQQPSFNLSYLYPVNRKLALSFGVARSWRLKQMERGDISDTQSDWNLVDLFQRSSTFYSLRSLLSTWSGQVGADWKVSPRDTISVSFQERLVSNFIMRNDFVANYGTGAKGDRTYTQGATTGVGTVSQQSGTNRETATDTSHLTLRYKHRGDKWRFDAYGAYSRNRSILDDIDDGHFDSSTISIKNLILRGEGAGENDALIPVRYSATTRTGAPVDVYNGANYIIGSVDSSQFNVVTKRYNGRLDLARDFDGIVPITIKVGTYCDQQTKDQKTYTRNWAFNPKGSATTDADRLAGYYDVFDKDYNATGPDIFGKSMGWVSLKKLYDLYLQQPTWFTLNEAGAYTNIVNNSRKFIETISSGYVRADTKLLQGRVWLVGGVRYERTADEGWGPLNDPFAKYQKDAQGNLILSGGKPVAIPGLDALGVARLQYRERGAHAKRTYGDYYPSINGTVNITENILIRAGYARTIGRPDLGNITPGATIADPANTVAPGARPIITVNNTGLKPWTADGYDIALETYNLKGGAGSIGMFQKNISNFFGVVTQTVTPELLALYGLSDNPAYLNYDFSTRSNVGDAKITGYEFNYSQSLKFLPHWARGFQVFFNYTKLKVQGDRSADFTGFAPKTIAGGINFVRSRLALKLTYTHQGDTLGTAVAVSAANGIPANTYNYSSARTRWGINAQYSFSKRLGVYFTMTDLFDGMTTLTQRYAPNTPDYARNVRRQELGSAITVGIKGQF